MSGADPATTVHGRVAVVIPAAGRSTRFGDGNKLLAELDGVPIILKTIDAALASGADPVIIVVDDADGPVARMARRRDVTFALNPAPENGIGGSVAAGVAALADDVIGAIIHLGDMPEVASTTLKALIAAAAGAPTAVRAPSRQGKRGNPVYWGRHWFPVLRGLSGDRGARDLIPDTPDVLVVIDDPGVESDVDTMADLIAARARRDGPWLGAQVRAIKD